MTDVVGARRAWPRHFRDRLTTPIPTWRDALRCARQGGFRTDPAPAAEIPVLRPGDAGYGLPAVAAGQIGLTWIGHASYVIQVGGLTVLADPVWSRRIPGVPARLTPPGVEWDDLPRVDAVVISHNHYDHLDGPTIRRLPRDTPVFVPGAQGRWFRRRGFTRVTELDWWESAELDGVRFDFVPAHHWTRRSLTDTCKTLWGGWIIGERVYFAGDTGYGDWFAEIGRRYAGLEVALMPVGAYLPRWFMSPVHIDPTEAVRACEDIGVPRMATMHWGTFMLSSEPLLAPRDESVRAWAEAGRAPVDLWTPGVGESQVI